MNQIKVFLLMAGLTALLVVLGGYFGGRSGMEHAAPSGGSGTPALHSWTSGAAGWVPASGGVDDTDPRTRRPATMAAASLGGAAAREAGFNRPDPGHSS